MGKYKFTGKFKGTDSKVSVVLSLMSFQENDVTIIYSPALDLSGYGTSEKKAKESFEIALEEFIRYTINNGTFDSELRKLGWKVSGRKTSRNYKQPNFDELLKDKEYLINILRDKEFRKFNQQVSFPASA